MHDDADVEPSWAWFCEALFYESAERRFGEEIGLLDADDESFVDESFVDDGDPSDDLALMAQTLAALGEPLARHSDLAEDLVIGMCVADRLPRELPELVDRLEPRLRDHWDRRRDDPPIDLEREEDDDLYFDDDEMAWDSAKERAGEDLYWTEELRPLLSVGLTDAPDYAPSADHLAALVEALAEVIPHDVELVVERGPEHVRASVAGTSVHLTLPPKQDDARDRLRAMFRALHGYREGVQVLLDAASVDTGTRALLVTAAPIERVSRTLHLLAGPAEAFESAQESDLVEVLDRHMFSPPHRESMESLVRTLSEHGWLDVADANVAAVAVEIDRACAGEDAAMHAHAALMNDARVRELWLGVEELEQILERW